MTDVPVKINTSLPYSDLLDTMAQAVLGLLRSKFEGTQVYYGHRAIGAKDSSGPVAIPCLMLEPLKYDSRFVRVQKWHQYFPFTVYFYVIDANREALARRQSAYAAALVKLFSNNAQGTSDGTYYRYSGYWNEAKLGAVDLSPTFTHGDFSEKYIRAGRAPLEIFAESNII